MLGSPAGKRARAEDAWVDNAEAGSVPPQLLSLLLEMRAEILELRRHIGTKLDALDERVARVERSTGRGDGPGCDADSGPTAGAWVRRVVRTPARPLRLVGLSTDLLAIVASALPEDDELPASLACRKLRAAVAQRRRSDERTGCNTHVASAFGSHARLAWSVSCGMPLTPLLPVQPAGAEVAAWVQAQLVGAES
ncbi:hypothetical protein KFE25_005439 [Diacronema lutheri]|uniref:Uncharacterized protein n=1 Tax=Diacronema lutheri TaxID=2081491 RepID=A0A8J5XM66_DIALT|nr:hypothetical protein KFE25_005439 [Diacronema lutheri]